MKVLVIGGGGREHALCWKLSKSPSVTQILCAPGNPGIASLATCHDIAATDTVALLGLARQERVQLTIAGPEAPLAAGVADAFLAAGLKFFGPSERAAQLEASKAYAKVFMQRYRIPTAHYGIFTDVDAALAFAAQERLPLVVKEDGLAAGKGVTICHTRDGIQHTIRQLLPRGATPAKAIVIEQFLAGEELSCIAIVDGERYVLLDASQDHKAIGDGDIGPNTGGMGAYTPVPLWTPALEVLVRREIIEPTIRGLQQEGRPFVGFLYAGLMIVDGNPFVLEYNVRCGDPEAQALLFRLRSDLGQVLLKAAQGRLEDQAVVWDERSSVCVVMAAQGYPGKYASGQTIHGLERVAVMPDVMVFHAGTQRIGDAYVTAGGRVLGVTALGRDLTEARQRAYAAVEQIHWDGAYYRHDIGARATKYLL